jgi:hypothetical protein
MDSKGALKGKAIKYINEHSQQSFAEVTEMTGSVLACRRLFKPRDISGYLNSGGRHEYCGEREFYRSNETLTLTANKVLETFDIVQLQDYHKGSGLLIRQDYDVLNRTFKPAALPPVCLCKQPLNPDMHFEVCNRCNQAFHKACLMEGNSCPDCAQPFKHSRPDTLIIDTPKKQVKENSGAPRISENTVPLPIDIDKYKTLTPDSRDNLLRLVQGVHQSSQLIQGSFNNESKTRQQIINKITCALYLALEESKSAGTPIKIHEHIVPEKAMEIEAALYISTGSKASGSAYKGKVRAVTFNLCDEKNPDFRSDVLKGEIQPKEIVSMQSRDMASSAMKQLREERQRKYEEEQLIAPTEGAKLMVKTHKGEAVIDVQEDHISDITTTDIIESVTFKNKVPEMKGELDYEETAEDDPFNPETYSVHHSKPAYEIYPVEGEGFDRRVYELARDWTPTVLKYKVSSRLREYLKEDQAARILSQINSSSLNK